MKRFGTDDESQLNLPPSLLRPSEQPRPVLPKSEQVLSADAASRLASVLFDEAVHDAKLRNQDIAYLLNVSESLVRKWRSAEERECPSLGQMLRLPLSFHVNLHRAMNRHFGFGRAALARILDDLGLLAAVAGHE